MSHEPCCARIGACSPTLAHTTRTAWRTNSPVHGLACVQVMPQLLNHLQQDEMDSSALDWGTLVVYACSRSCGAAGAGGAAGSSYAEEFVWMQPT